jgi:hypothetical protein
MRPIGRPPTRTHTRRRKYLLTRGEVL